MVRYEFVENQDFTTVTKNLENGGRSIDYYITLDMAKELSNEVRTATDPNGDIYFCLVDVADVLEISNANPSRFNLDEKGVHKMYTPTNGGVQQLTFINEPNLYRVIFRMILLKIKTSFASTKKWKRTIPMVVVRANITKHKPFQMRLSN